MKSKRKAAKSQNKRRHPKGWVKIQAPPNLDEMFQSWIDCEEPNCGWCFMCNGPIRSAADLIEGTNFHNCEAGRRFEEKTRPAEVTESTRKRSARTVAKASKSERDRSSLALESQVGVFWWFNGRMILEATPLSQAERYAESLIHGKGHVDRWAELQADGSVPSDVEYDRIPRGRVSYDAVRDQFLVLRDRCIPMKAIRQVISTLHLPKDKVVVAGDPHYRCPRCMEKGTE
jgi:hypothetical protein